MGFEPTTPTLARLCSTPELRPHPPQRMIQGRRRVCKACVRASENAPCASMPVAPLTPEELFSRLDGLEIAHRTYTHPPVFTVAEAAALRGSLPGGHCKSLFLKDKKGGFWLAVMLEERRIDLPKLAARLQAPRFSFGGADDLYRLLGVRPGSVTPFALVNDARAQRHPGPRRRDAALRPAQLPSLGQRPDDRRRAGRSAALHRRVGASAAHRRARRPGSPEDPRMTPQPNDRHSRMTAVLVFAAACRHVGGSIGRGERCRAKL